MFFIVLRRSPILSKAGWSDAAAKTAMLLWADWDPPLPPPQALSASTRARILSRLITRQLNPDVCRLDHGDSGHARLELQLIHRFAREQRDESMWPGLDLDLRRDAVFDDAGDDAGKAVPRRLCDRRLGFGRPLGLGEAREGGAVDQPLSAGAANRGEAPVVDHASHCVWADPEHLGSLTEPIVRHCSTKPSICQSSGEGR